MVPGVTARQIVVGALEPTEAGVTRTSLRMTAFALAVGLVVSGCGGDPASKSSDLVDDELVVTTPAGTEPVDEVVWGLPTGEPTGFDPIYAGASSEMTTVANMCESLLVVEPDFSIGAGLATSVEFTDDTTLVIDLRENVSFWDGQPMTADDVVFSLNRAADPSTGSYYAGAFRLTESIEKTGPLQVTVHLSAPDAQLRNALAGPAGSVVQAKFTQQAGRAFGTAEGGVMCTGPYEFVTWNTGENIVMKANPDYWGGEPLVGQITLQFIADTATLTSALRSGEIDGAYDLPVSTAVALQGGDSGTVYRGPSTASLSFGPTTDKGPAANPRVREALDLAIDKQGLIDSVLRGLGTTQRTFTAPLAWSGDPAADIYQEGYDALPENDEQDLERAKQLIEEAGVGDTTLVMAIPAGASTETQAATVVQAAAKSIGVNLELRTLQPTEFSELFYIPEKRAGFDFVCTVGYQEVPGSLYYAPEFALKGGLYNWSGYDNPEVAELLDQARASTDPEVTAEKFVEAQALFAPDRLQVTLAGVNTLLYMRSGLSGAPASIAYYASPWALHLGGTA